MTLLAMTDHLFVIASVVKQRFSLFAFPFVKKFTNSLQLFFRADKLWLLNFTLSNLNFIHKLKKPMKTKIKIVHWIPRILCILAILFVSVFALDSFDPNLTIWQQIGGFLIHLIPTFILIFLLFIAWKWELIGGIIFTALGIGLSPGIYFLNVRMNHSVLESIGIILMITFPFILVGVLFIISHFLKKKQLIITKSN
jgi:hypothetical protein